jgi:F0F1-type ATP synthase assembly protein I
MIKKLVVASTLIIPILLVVVVYGWESIFAGSVIWFLIWFVILGLSRGLWSLGKETNKDEYDS